MDDVRGERGADKAVAAVRVVVEAHLQRDQAVLAQIEGLLGSFFLKSQKWISRPYLRWPTSSRSKPGMKVFGAAHSERDHDVVARLVPEVVIELHAAQVVLPAADDVEVLVEMQEAAGRVALRVAEHRDDDVRAEAMHRMRRRQIGLGLDLAPSITLCRRGVLRVGAAVDDVQVGRAHAGHDQIAPLLARIAMARRAGIPAHVMQLVADARHLQPLMTWL